MPEDEDGFPDGELILAADRRAPCGAVQLVLQRCRASGARFIWKFRFKTPHPPTGLFASIGVYSLVDVRPVTSEKVVTVEPAPGDPAAGLLADGAPLQSATAVGRHLVATLEELTHAGATARVWFRPSRDLTWGAALEVLGGVFHDRLERKNWWSPGFLWIDGFALGSS
jgi:hypothetical protein